MTGCQPVSTDLRTVLLISGISIVPIAGIARAACWMMRVSGFKRFADALQHVKRRRPPPPPPSSSSFSPHQDMDNAAASAAAANGLRSNIDQEESTLKKIVPRRQIDFSDFGTFCYGVFLGFLVEMLICVVAVALQWSYPSALSIDVEITVLFAWPLLAVARAGLQRWVWLDFPVYDGRVWCYFLTFDTLLVLYVTLTWLLGSQHLWGPVAALLVLVVLGSFIPLAEMGGRAVDDLRRLSWFGLSWGVVACCAHVGSHALVLFVISPPLTIGYISADSVGEGAAPTRRPPCQMEHFFWIVLLTGTFIAVPTVVHLSFVLARVLLDG